MLRPPNRPSPAAPDAAESLIRSVLRVAARAQRLLRIRGLALAIAAVALAALIAGSLDWAAKTPPAWLRWCLSATLLAVLLTALVRLVVPALRTRLTPVQAARRIERVFPSLDDRLSSVVALAATADATAAGNLPASSASLALQRQAANQLRRDVAGVDLGAAIDARPTLRAVAAAAACVLALTAVAMAWPAATSLAARRLAMPWVDAPWPRQHELQLAPLPAAIYAGTATPITVTDRRGRLPADTTILVRSSSDTRPRPLPAQRGSRAGNAELVGLLRASRGDAQVWVRAVGGDDHTMPWHPLMVQRPPQLTGHRFAVAPPTYTGLPAHETTATEFAVAVGSQLRFQATVDRPLQSARLVAMGRSDDAAAADPGRPLAVPLQISAAGTQISGQLPPLRRQGTLQWTLQWTDRQAIVGTAPTVWTIHSTPDTPPRPQWIRPQGDLDVTADAVIPLAWETTDDYGLTSTALQVAVGQTPEEKPQRTELRLRWSSEAAGGGPAPAAQPAAEPVLQQQRDATLQLSDLGELTPGTWVQLRVVAMDARPQQGASPPLRLNIVDAATVQSRLVRDSQQVLQQIVQARRDQTIATEKTREAASRVGDSQQQAQAATDLARLAQRAQQDATGHVADGSASALQTARDAVALAEVNRLEGPSIDALRQAKDQLESIRDQFLRPATDQLRETVDQPADAAAQRQSLDQIADLQQAAGDALAKLADQLESHVETDSLAEALREAADAQQRLAGASTRIEQATSPAAERRRLANLQRQMARDNEQLAARMDRRADAAAAGEDPQSLRQAADALRQQRIADRMRDAANAMDDNQVAQATSQQQAIAADLRAVATALQSGSAPHDPVDLARQTARLADRQQWTADQIAAVVDAQGAAAAAAASDQRQLAGETEQVQRAVADLPLFADVMGRAAQSMLSAAARLDRSPTDRAAVDDARGAQVQLQAVADALAVLDRRAGSQPPQPDANATEPSPEPGDTDGGIPEATVLLMRSIQQHLRDATQQLQSVDRQSLDDDQQRDFDRRRREVARQQQWLAAELATLLDSAARAASQPSSASQPSTHDAEGAP